MRRIIEIRESGVKPDSTDSSEPLLKWLGTLCWDEGTKERTLVRIAAMALRGLGRSTESFDGGTRVKLLALATALEGYLEEGGRRNAKNHHGHTKA